MNRMEYMATKRSLPLLGLFFLVFSAVFISVLPAHADDTVELLVGLKPDVQAPAWPSGVEKVRHIRGSRIFRIWVDPLREAEVTATLEAEDSVAFVERAEQVRVKGLRSEIRGHRAEGDVGWAVPTEGMRIGALPGTASVTRWQEQIHVSALSQLGSGGGVLVAVIDTGIDLGNPALTSRIWSNLDEVPGDNIDNDGNGFVDDVSGWDFGDLDNHPQDLNGHGTKVTSVVLGVAPSCSILPIKVNQGSLETFSMGALAEGIYYAVEQGAGLINISSSAASFSSAVSAAIADAFHQGVLIAAAAGNSGWDVEFPANLAETIAVGAIDNFSAIAWFSNFGPELDMTAPGEDMEVIGLGGITEFVSGTSFSTPIVSGVAAVLKSMNPHLRIETVRKILLQGTVDLGDPGRDTLYGTGALDGNQIFGLAAPRITLPAYPFLVSQGQGAFEVGIHLPQTDTRVDLYIAILAGESLRWLGSDISWHDSALEPIASVARASIDVQLPDFVLYGFGGLFLPLDPLTFNPGSYLFGIALVEDSGRLVGPITFSEMVIN